MELNDKLFDYLKSKIPTFEKITKSGSFLFTCPNIGKHKYIGKSPTATIISGTDKISCLQCNWRGNIYDAVRVLEEDKSSFTDGQIMEHLINTMKIDAYPELEEYKKYGWNLFVICKNGKKPIKDEHWREKEFNFTEKSKWLDWIKAGFNLAANCEFSNIMIVDFDDKAVTPEFQNLRNEFKDLLDDSKTLIQNTPHGGKHYIFKYDAELCFKQKVDLGGGLKIDTRTHKGYFLVSPSKVDGNYYNWTNIGNEIKVVPENLKLKLLEIINKKEIPIVSLDSLQSNVLPQENVPELKNNNLDGCCNDVFVRLGGVLINKFTPEQTEFILSLMNRNLLKNPMPQSSIQSMLGSLAGYKQTEEQTQELAIYECCKLLQVDITANEVEKHTGFKKAIVNKYLAKFNMIGKLVRKKQGRYDCKQEVFWTDEQQKIGQEYKYKIPYFNTVAKFIEGNIILIGSPQAHGKTTVAANFIRKMKEQGVKPYYITTESGSSFEEDIKDMGMSCADYYTPKVDDEHPPVNPIQVEIQPNAFTIIDWLDQAEDFAQTQTILKHFNEEMRSKLGILIIFVQIRGSYEWFAPDLIKAYPAFAARYIWDDDTVGLRTHFDCDKIRNPRGHYSSARIDCKFTFENKELKEETEL